MSHTRSEKDIRKIVIYTEVMSRHGWIVDMLYTDKKMVSLQIDPSEPDQEDMLEATFDMIKKQLKSEQPD